MIDTHTALLDKPPALLQDKIMDEFKLDRLPDYEEETLIAEVRRVAGIIVTDKITRTEFDKHGLISASGLHRRFGSWQAVLEKAGLGHRYCQPFYSPKNDATPAGHLSDEELLEILASVSRLTGKSSVTKREFSEHTNINATYLARRFGSWRAALEMAGLQQSPGGKRYTDEECFENMLKVWTHYGRPPEYLEMTKHPSTVGPKAYITRWKTWNKALHAFVKKVNADERDSSPPSSGSEDENTEQSTSAKPSLSKTSCTKDADRREIKLGLRYRVLKRDDFKCVLCGRSPASNPGLELHVDHIMPFSRGGKTVEENLRATCADCNLGKGARIESR